MPDQKRNPPPPVEQKPDPPKALLPFRNTNKRVPDEAVRDGLPGEFQKTWEFYTRQRDKWPAGSYDAIETERGLLLLRALAAALKPSTADEVQSVLQYVLHWEPSPLRDAIERLCRSFTKALKGADDAEGNLSMARAIGLKWLDRAVRCGADAHGWRYTDEQTDYGLLQGHRRGGER